MEVKIGDRVRCKVTGFEGIAYGRYECITGCIRFDVHPPAVDGKKPDSEWVDDTCLEVVDMQAVALTVKLAEPAGPMNLSSPHGRPG